MNKVAKDFISDEPRAFRFKVGRFLASSLSGFIAGVVCATIIWGYVVAILIAQQSAGLASGY